MPFPQTPSPLSVIVAAKTYNAQWFSGATKEAQITNAIASAATDGAKYVFVPASMLPYNAVSVTFNSAIRMLAEGSDFSTYDPVAYGAFIGQDSSTAIQAAINSCPANGVVKFSSSGQYILDTGLIDNGKDNVTIDLNGSELLAKAAVSYEKMLAVSGRTKWVVKNGTFNANKTNRVSAQAIRFMGPVFTNCTESMFVDITVKNTRGLNGPSVGITLSGCTRCKVIRPILLDCGDAEPNASDGVFMSGDENQVSNGIAERCTDTGFVVESGSFSGIVNCTAIDCTSPSAISNAAGTDQRGNYINGLTSRCNLQGSTGQLFIGVPGATAGHLIGTIVSNVQLYTPGTTTGTGPIVAIAQGGSGRVKGLQLNNIRIIGGSTQGVNVDGDDVVLNNIVIDGISGTETSGIRIATGSLRAVVEHCDVNGCDYGIAAIGTAQVTSKHNILRNQTAYGIYAFDTSIVNSIQDVITNPTTGYRGKDAGAVLNLVNWNQYNTLTYSSSMTPDMASGANYFDISANNGTAFTINAPTNLPTVLGPGIVSTDILLTITIRNTSGGVLGAVTWSSIYKLAAWTQPTNGNSRSITFRYNGTNLVEISRTPADVPN